MVKTIGLTFDTRDDYQFKEGDPLDANAEFDHLATIDVIAGAFESLGYKVKRIGNVYNLIENLEHLNVDIVFNIAEGYQGRNREAQVPILLEMKGIPYVGSDALTLSLTLDKIMAKKVFRACGIPTPQFIEVKDAGRISEDHLRFPLIVKPRFEGSSKGLDEQARVDSCDELINRSQYIIKTYKQPVLVEEFIKGYEFTVAIIGNQPPTVLAPVQVKIDGRFDLGEDFYTFGRISSPQLEYVCPAAITAELEDKLKDLARQTYEAVDCRDFGRVDFRVDEKNNPYVLELNPLPSLSVEDIFMLLSKIMKISYPQMLERILISALKRYNL